MWFPWGKHAYSLLGQLVPAKDDPYFGTAISALLIGWVGAHAINIVLGLTEKIPFLHLKPLKLRVVERYEPPADSPNDSYFTLLLLLSGYRDEATMSMVETINYADKTDLGDREDPLVFLVTLSMSDVVSANFFDLNIYKQHFAERQMLLR